MIRSRKKRGVSLVELLVVMSAATVILTMSTTLIHRLMRTQSRARLVADGERSSLRLSESFRNDVHRARSSRIDQTNLPDDVLVRLQLTDGTSVEYGQENAKILRVARESGKVVAREEFAFPASIEATLKRPDDQSLVLTVTARAERASPVDGHPPMPAEFIPVDLQVAALALPSGAP